MPSSVKKVVDHIGRLHYSSAYCASTGSVQKKKVLVNDTTMQIPQKYTADEV